jgi:TatD DNase family protein
MRGGDTSARAWADIHAHLFDCPDGELGRVIDEAESCGVGMIVNTATSIDTARAALGQCGRFLRNLRAAAGISPFDAADLPDGWDAELKSLLAHPLIAAVGEIGLDCANPSYPPLSAQMPVFAKQLEIAAGAGLPAVIHSRGIEKRAAEICRDAGVKKAVFHCFTGDAEAMEYILRCGYYISISGIITYKNSHLREIVKHIPVDKLLIETDAPYLAPVPHRGEKNRPALLIYTARETAGLLGIGEDEFSRILRDNVFAAFGI